MSTFDQLKNGLSHAWEHLAEGWRDLTQRASHALTHFHPLAGEKDDEEGRQVMMNGSRWGILAAEVRSDEDRVVVDVEAPGLDSGSFHIEIRDHTLIVRGEKSVEREEKRGRYHVMERAYGAFERAIRLPAEVDEEGTKASYKNGVLRVVMPKSRHLKTRRIEVQSG